MRLMMAGNCAMREAGGGSAARTCSTMLLQWLANAARAAGPLVLFSLSLSPPTPLGAAGAAWLLCRMITRWSLPAVHGARHAANHMCHELRCGVESVNA